MGRWPAIVVAGGGERRLELLRWGLILARVDDPGIGFRMTNACSETVAEKPSLCKALKNVVARYWPDGFYEWQKANGGKQPYRLKMEDRGHFAFAERASSWW
jgi:putative SOS response-associated peptidase YedK